MAEMLMLIRLDLMFKGQTDPIWLMNVQYNMIKAVIYRLLTMDKWFSFTASITC